MSSSYQVAVIGDHLGGLAAAALASRRGNRVLLLESAADGRPRPFEQLNAIAGGPEQEPGLGRFFQEIGLAPFGPLGDDRIHFHALAPPLQICAPRHRVSLYADRTARAWELQREFGEAHRALGRLWQLEEQLRARLEGSAPQSAAAPLALRALSSVSGFVRLQLLERETGSPDFASYLAAQGLSPELSALAAAQAQAIYRRPAGELTWAEGLRALRVANGGLYRNAGGQSGMLEGLRAVLLSRGGDARPLVALESIDLPRTGGARLHLAAEGTVRADRVIVDLPLAEALRLLPAETVKTLERKGLAEREEQEYALLEFALAAERRPEGMGCYLALDPSGGAPGAPVVHLAARSFEEAAEGRCEVEALGIFPPGGATAGREHLLACVRSVLPFYEESLVGAARFTTGAAPRFLRGRFDQAQRGERLAAGWRTGVFALAPFAFLRHEEYAGTSLAEALFAGALAIS